jgi:glutamate-1-semialdehyde 2,1-aminomutase
LAERLAGQVESAIAERDLPWSVARLGARTEYRFCDPPPVDGTGSAEAEDHALNEYLHLYLGNRGVLITPFHNMMLTCPATTADDVDRHGELFTAAIGQLVH